MGSPTNHNTPGGPVVNPLATHGRATRPSGNLTLRQVLTTLYRRHRVQFLRFSHGKIPFDARHRTWGLRLSALLRTLDDPDLLIGWIPASVGLTVVDVDSGDFLTLVQEHPPAYHNASGTPGRRHLMYRDTEARADVNGWEAKGCRGDVRSAGPVILYDARRLLAALDIGPKGERFPPSTFKTHPQQAAQDTTTRTPTNPTQDTREGNPLPPSDSPGRGDKVAVTASLSLSTAESSQPSSLFDRLRFWAYAHVADAGDAEDWAEAVQCQAEVLVTTVPENYSAARVRTTARSVSAWTWERRTGFTGGRRYVGAAAQAWRGRRSAEARWADHADRDAEVCRLSLAGFSQRTIARSMGVSAMAINRVLKRLEEAEDGAPELRMDAPEPKPVAEDQDQEDQDQDQEDQDQDQEDQDQDQDQDQEEAEAGAVVIGPDTLGEARSSKPAEGCGNGALGSHNYHYVNRASGH